MMRQTMAAAQQQGAGGVVVSDSFNRPDSATTMGDADTGQTWMPNTPSPLWGISGNAAYLTGTKGNTQDTTVVESGLSDCVVEVTFAVVGDAGLCWRSVDDNNQFIHNTTQCFRKQGGSFTAVGASFTALSNGDVLRLELVGSSHELFVNGVSVTSFTDTFQQTATAHGLRCNGNNTTRFDDFTITA